jgi:predicted N-acyltransferase
MARKAGTPFVAYKEFAPQDLPELRGLSQLGYKCVPNLPVNLLPVRFAHFQEYISALRSIYRRTIHKSEKKLQREGITIERIEDPADIQLWYTEEVHGLYLAVVERAEYQFEILTSRFFRSLAQAFPGDFGVSVARTASGQTIGFASSLCVKGYYHGLYIGLDYAWNARCDVYFNLMYAELEYALRRHVHMIDLGQTADAFKARLGCEQEERSIFVRVRGGLRPRLLRLALPLLFPAPPAMPQLRVFSPERAADLDLST